MDYVAIGLEMGLRGYLENIQFWWWTDTGDICWSSLNLANIIPLIFDTRFQNLGPQYQSWSFLVAQKLRQ